MGTKPTAKKSASKPARTKTTKTTTVKSKSVRPTTPKKRHTPTKASDQGRIIACVVGAIAAVALIIIGIVALVHSINTNGKNNMTVETGTGEKIETQYLGFEDFAFRIKIPKAFHALTDAEIKNKYFVNIPDIVYTDDANEVNIAILPTDTPLENDQIETYLEATSSTLSMSGSRVLTSKLIKQGEHNIGTIQFITDSTEGKYYNYTAFVSQEGHLTIITFNVKDVERETWQPVADFIMKSLDFVK